MKDVPICRHAPGPFVAKYFSKQAAGDWCGWYIQRPGVGLAKICTVDAIDYSTGAECQSTAMLLKHAPKMFAALKVLTLTPAIVESLLKIDPKALEQAITVISSIESDSIANAFRM